MSFTVGCWTFNKSSVSLGSDCCFTPSPLIAVALSPPVNTRPSSRSCLAALTALLAVGFCVEASAQSVTTVPVGAVTTTIAAGTGSSRTVTVLSFPLIDTPLAAGQVVGKITGVSTNSLTNTNASWTAGALSVAASPYLIQITSGTAKGRTFLVSTSNANTSDTLTIDSEESGLVDLTTLGIVTGSSGDGYRLIPCDTLSSILGTPATTGVQGGTTSATSDIALILVSGGWRQYYYNTTSNTWLRVTFNTNADNLPIRPDSVVIYNRLAATTMALTLIGTVPNSDRKAIVRNSGITTAATFWPVDATLLSSNIHLMSGWVSSTNSSVADTVMMLVSGGWRQYYYDGTNWKRVTFNTISDSVAMSAASGVIINKRGSGSGATVLAQTTPYTL